MEDDRDYEAEMNVLRERIADLEAELAIAKAMQPQITWYPAAGTQTIGHWPYTTTTTTIAPPYNFHISGSNWCGT